MVDLMRGQNRGLDRLRDVWLDKRAVEQNRINNERNANLDFMAQKRLGFEQDRANREQETFDIA